MKWVHTNHSLNFLKKQLIPAVVFINTDTIVQRIMAYYIQIFESVWLLFLEDAECWKMEVYVNIPYSA